MRAIRVAMRFSQMRECHYKLLNVSTEATQDEIKQAYFTLAKKYHPDTNPNSQVDPMKFQLIQDAYTILSNPEKRAVYDQANGIINRGMFGTQDFGPQQTIYSHFSSINMNIINEQAKAEYFEKQYFSNKEYFKRKVNEDSHWNMSEKLFMDHHHNIKQAKAEWVLHQPTTDEAYFVKKDELKEVSFGSQAIQIIKDFKYIWGSLSVAIIGFLGYTLVDKLGEGKQSISEESTLNKGPGYKLKMLPINIA